MTAAANGTIPEWTLGDRLRKARELTGLTAQEFATTIGVSRGTITNAETDARHVRPITIRAYALATGVPLEWLETGKSPAQPEGPDGGFPGLGHARTGVWDLGLLAPTLCAA